MPSEKVLQQKKQTVAEITERLKGAAAGVLVDYRGLTVEQDTDLRNKLREAGVQYTVVKNTLTRFAAKEVGFDALDEILHGPTSLATSDSDVIVAAKVLVDFAKKNEAVEIKAGFIEGKVVGVDEVKALASIPSKEILLARMLGSLMGPVTGLAVALNAVVERGDMSAAPKAEETPAPAEVESAPAPAEDVKVEETAPAVEEAKAEDAPAEETPTEAVAPAEEAPTEEAAPAVEEPKTEETEAVASEEPVAEEQAE